MSFGHSEVSFNHSCLKVPVNSLSRRPAPKYERLLSAKNSEAKHEDKKEYHLSDFTNFTSIKKYLEFYESIPDYSELHHLSNEEFYSRLKSLKITQKRLCNESGIWSSVNSEDEVPIGKYNYDGFGSREKGRTSEIKKADFYATCACFMCSPVKDHCGMNEFYKKTNPKISNASVGIKQPLPKINIISDNENASDLYDPEFKKHSDYEADQESSTLQVNGKLPGNGLKNHSIEEECFLGNCSKRSRSLPISPACECDSLELCHGFCDATCRKECMHSSCNASKKDTQTLIKKPKNLHSRPIPLTSRIPLFDKIMMEKEARRRIMHDLYSEELRSLVKPFSFTKRQEEKERRRLISSNPELTSVKPPLVRFKAKPIPKNLFSNYAYERMREDEFYRALKKRVRAEEMLKSSSLPLSMALREKKFRSRSLDFLDCRSPKRSWNKVCAYRRACKNIKREIEFDEKSKNGSPQKRKHKSPWMSESRRTNSATDSSTEISPYESILNPERRRKGRPHSAFSCSKNNLASVLRIETARKRLEKEMEEKLRESRLKDQAKFKAHLARMDPAWRALRYDKNEDLALRMAARRREERLKKENHQRLMESIYGRVYSMPPLFHKERFHNGKSFKLQDSINEKDVVPFSYNNSAEKPDNDMPEPEKDSKSYDFSIPFGNRDNCRSQESSESAATCEKNEKVKAYESDAATNET